MRSVNLVVRRNILGIALGLIASLGIAHAVHATPISYVFAPGASLSFGGVDEAVSGAFTFDAETGVESNVTITLTGAAPYAGTYTAPGPATIGSNGELEAFGPTGQLFIDFSQPLNVSPTPIGDAIFIDSSGIGVSGASGFGSAVFALPPSVNLTITKAPDDFCGHGVIIVVRCVRVLQYDYSFNDLSGTGDIIIPISKRFAFLEALSVPSGLGVNFITDGDTIHADWPGAGNTIPTGKSYFDDPEALLEVSENGNSSVSFSFLYLFGPINGPISIDGTLLDPPVPGPEPVPEPGTLWLFIGALGAAAAIVIRRPRGSAVTA